ncbi:MAG: HTTM domain-containing protein [Myxococcota bacterium]
MPNAFLRWLSDSPQHRQGLRAFQFLMGLAMAFRVATEFRFAGWLYGPHGIGTGTSVSMLRGWHGAIDWVYQLEATPFLVVLVEGVAATLFLWGRHTRLAAALGLFTVQLLEWRTPEILDGGDNLTRLCLGFMLLTLSNDAPAPPKGSFAVFLHNVGVVLLLAQIVVLYFSAGLAKAGGQAWTNGTALFLVSQVEEFSLPSLRWLFKEPLVTSALSQLTVLWQLLFPLGVFSRLRWVFVVTGLGFHLGIAFFMGLVSFSLVMLGAELFLLSDEDHLRVRGWWAAWLAKLRPSPASVAG